ncbi:C39 family peptidase [Enterococcus sp. AZ196]|uniref:C39 family peptidase n=1 Tax=Enterococcus sp. AZ196 TaxID=2774659 RepID=UPI003D285377
MEKKRFKMYKSGKSWVIAPIVFFGLLGLSFVNDTQEVHADEVLQTETVVAVETENEQIVPNNTVETPNDSELINQADDVESEVSTSKENTSDEGNQLPADKQSETEDAMSSEKEAEKNVETTEESINDFENAEKEDEPVIDNSTNEVVDETPSVDVSEKTETEETETEQTKKESIIKENKTSSTTKASAKVEMKAPTKKSTVKKVSIPIYRVYNPNSGEHLHTMNGNERNHLVRLGWRDEGISMYVDGTGNQLFRLYNPNSGEHFFTLNAKERDNLKRHGWRYEGVAWKTPVKGVPMYRVYNPNTRGAGAHHYTMDVNERNSLVRKGWRNEGISWYTLGGSKPVASYVLLNAPFIDQQAAGFPMGCEAASLLQALHLKGYAKNYNLNSFIKQQPKSPNNNPNNGFSGDPGNIVSGVYHSIFSKPLANWGSKYGKVSDISGYSVEDLKNELRKGNPVVVYVTLNFEAPRYGNYWWGKGINNAHIMTLDGFNEANQTYHVSDPNGKKGGKYWVPASKFESSYNTRRSAVVVR